MQKDFDERAKRRKVDRNNAEEFKKRGNDCMKKGLYKSSAKHYSDALEHQKDNLAIYTNLALAKLKLEQW